MRTVLLSSACLAAVTVLPTTARAADWLELPAVAHNANSPRTPRSLRTQLAQVLPLDGIELGAPERRPSAAGVTYRMEQRHRGLLVLDGALVARVDASGELRVLSSTLARRLRVDPTPKLDATAAFARARLARPALPTTLEHAALAVLARDGGHLVWQIDTSDRHGGTRFLVDAHDGAVLAFRALRTHALGRVYRVSQKTTPVPEDLELATLDVAASPVRLDGWGGLLRVANYVSGNSRGDYTLEQALGPSSGVDFLYDPPAQATDPKDAFAQVNLFFHLTHMRGYFTGLGVDMTSSKWKLTAVANLLEDGQPLDNAFFSQAGVRRGDFAAPNLIGIGQGRGLDFAYDSDVFKHEFTHYVSGNAIGYNLGQFHYDEYGLSPFSGAIDEGLADYFACSDNGDPVLGESALSYYGAGRDLSQTGKTCPNSLVGEVHADGELIGSTAWSIRGALGQERADALVWAAMLLLTPGANFQDFARALETSATAMQTEGKLDAVAVAEVRRLLEERGLAACGAVQELIPEQEITARVLGLDLLARAFGASCGDLEQYGVVTQALQHWVVQPQAGTELLAFVARLRDERGELPPFTIYVRRGEHVRFQSDPRTGIAKAEDYDWSQRFENTRRAELVIDARSTPAFDPSQRYFVAVTSETCAMAELELKASARSLTGGSGAGGGAGSGGTGGVVEPGGTGGTAPLASPEFELAGGGCALSGAAPVSSAWLALAAAGLALGRRRSRRSSS